MQYLSQEIQNDIRWHALDEYPNECCGIIVEQNHKSICINCDNVSADKQLSFEISGKDYLKAQSKGAATLLHSKMDLALRLGI